MILNLVVHLGCVIFSCFVPPAQMADYSYRAAVRELVPQLRYLDDVKVEEDRLSCCTTMGEDWDILRNSIRDSNSSYPAGDGVCVCAVLNPSTWSRYSDDSLTNTSLLSLQRRQPTVYVLTADPVQPHALLPASPVSGPCHRQAPDHTQAPDSCQRSGLEFSPLLDPDLVLQT